MPKVIVSPLAQADIDEIWDHIARDSVPNADRFVDGIERRFGLLAGNPGLRSRRDDLRPGLRRFAHARYLIYYRAIRGGIEVVRVVHGHASKSRSSDDDGCRLSKTRPGHPGELEGHRCSAAARLPFARK
jgi:toxin ParE1/3/4